VLFITKKSGSHGVECKTKSYCVLGGIYIMFGRKIYKTPGRPSHSFKSLSTLTLILVTLIFTVGAAWGEEYPIPTADRTGLNSAFASANPGDTITFGTFPGINFAAAAVAATVSKNNQTLKGTYIVDFAAPIGTAESSIASSVGRDIAYNTAIASLQGTVSTLQNSVASSASTLSYIQGTGGPRTFSNSNPTTLNEAKLIRVNNSLTNFNVQGVSFKDLTSEITFAASGPSYPTFGGGVVNTVLGNLNTNAGDAGFGEISGSDFSNINITVWNNANPNGDYVYLAGGGIIGLRSTAGSVRIGTISSIALTGGVNGNVFRNLTVGTDGPYANQPYIEGGGIIGVDGVSTPSVAGGFSLISKVDDNLFYGITIDSKDILIGGGVVGVNNNSQNFSILSNAIIGEIKGNIFGSGDIDTNNGGISVKTGFSLRGGGVVGINALSNSYTTLRNLEANVFAGIKVSVGTYLRGGGVVGLQANDVGKYVDTSTDNNPCDTAKCPDVGTQLDSARQNVFMNIEVSTGDTPVTDYAGGNLEGGGVIGIRSNGGTAILVSANENIFRQITVTAKSTNPSTTTDNQKGDIRGGGIMGISSATSVAIGEVQNNYFDNIKISTTSNLLGGGVIGMDAAANVLSSGAASAGVFSNNTFMGTQNQSTFLIDVKGDTIGGGVIGISARTGNAIAINIDENTLNYINFNSNSLQGGGLIGFAAPTDLLVGNAYIGSVSDNKIDGDIITITKSITGGGLIGIYSERGQGKINVVNGNTITNSKISTTDSSKQNGYIRGGGIIGAVGTSGQAWIDDAIGNTIKANTVDVAGSVQTVDTKTTAVAIQGGGILGVYSLVGEGVINYVDNNTITDNTITARYGHISGGGIVGASGSKGTIHIDWVGNTTISANTINVNTNIIGSGVLGVYSHDGTAFIGTVNGNNKFEGNIVSTNSSSDALIGGGIIGVGSSSGYVHIDNVIGKENNPVEGNQISNNSVAVKLDIQGGGIIGVFTLQGGQTADKVYALIGRVSGNVFNSNKVSADVSNAGSIMGGGIIGASGMTTQVQITKVDHNVISQNTISSLDILGSGVIGVYTDSGSVSIREVSNNTFTGGTVNSADIIAGGGYIGAGGGQDTAKITSVQSNEFTGATVLVNDDPTYSGAIRGGGIVGTYSRFALAPIVSQITTISDNTITNASVTIDNGVIQGGGIIGATYHSTSAESKQANIGTANNNTISGSKVSATSASIQGGGVIGV
jgi:hypothetical protein